MKPTPRGFWAVWTTVAVDLIGFGILIPLLPLYAEDFGASPATIGALFATYSLAQVAFSPFWGRLSDRIGRRPVLLVTIAGSALGSLITGLAGALPILFVGRLIDGTSGASIAVARATVSDVASADERPRLMGLLGAAFGLGFVVGPVLGAAATFGGPAVPFFVAAFLSIANLIATWFRVPETAGPQAMASTKPSPAARPVGYAMRLIILTLVVVAAFSAFEATFSLLARLRVGLSDAEVALMFTGAGVLLVAVQGGLIGVLVRRYGEPRLLRIALGAMVVGFVVLSSASTWPILVTGVAITALGYGLVTPTLSSLIADQAASNAGRALGTQQSAGGLARVIGPLVGASLFGVAMPLPFVAAALLIAGSFGLVSAGRRRSNFR